LHNIDCQKLFLELNKLELNADKHEFLKPKPHDVPDDDNLVLDAGLVRLVLHPEPNGLLVKHFFSLNSRVLENAVNFVLAHCV